jgi:Holliday junction DNA helicase RuvA
VSPIARLKGAVLELRPDSLIVDVHGIGFLVYAPTGAISSSSTGSEISLHTHLAVREDGMTLYGFASTVELGLFQSLIGVSGVGPKVALGLLSVMPADDLSFAIASGDAEALSRGPGVGKKLASRIVLELRGKLTVEEPVSLPGGASDVVAALVSLGYSQSEASAAVAKSDFPDDAPVEDKVRLALAHFAGARAE